MTAQTDKVEFFHLNELPTNTTSNFTAANSCVSRHFNNKFAVMCEAFWVKFKRHCDSPTVTTASLDPNTFLVLFSFACIFVIIGLSVWVTKLTKRLRELEGQKIRQEYQSQNSCRHSLLYDINSQSRCSIQQPIQSYKTNTFKVLPSNQSSTQEARSSHILSSNSNCDQCGKLSSQLVRLSSIIDETLNQNSSFRSEEEVKKEVHNSNSTLRCHSIKSFDSSDEENVVSNKVHSEITKELENDWVSVKLEKVNCLHNT